MDVIDEIIRREGGYSNNPADAGGETKYGISKRAFPNEDIKNLTYERARFLYELKYVKGPGFDQLAPSILKEQLIDYGVNSGPHLAIMKLQEILNVASDGILGPATLSAIASCEVQALSNRLMAARLRMLANLVAKRPAQAQFLRGWVNRALEFLS